MAEAAAQKENAGESPSMEEILKSIRGVISGDEAAEGSAEDADEEMLELTEMEIAEDEAPISTDAGNSTTVSGAEVADLGGAVAEKSVLDDIDDALGADEAIEKKEEPKMEQEKSAEPEVAVPEVTAAVEAVPANDILEASAVDVKVGDGIDEEANPASGDTEKTSAKNNERLLKEKAADESSETLRSLVSNIPRTHVSSPYTKGGVTLEELTIEAMRPFLAEWLNENLPTIVKQIVSKEIKKLIPQDDDK
jgi:cell pole-organizing protein PopZ